MDFMWMGRYRALVSELMRFSNVAVKDSTEKHDIGDGILINNVEWQILEYIVEHNSDEEKMILISDKLGIPQASFSKAAKKLTDFGLLERFQRSDNKKDIILKPTDRARSIYIENIEKFKKAKYKMAVISTKSGIVNKLDINTIIDAFVVLNNDIEKGIAKEKTTKKSILIKKDKNGCS